MKFKFLLIIFSFFMCLSCQEEKIISGNRVSETFYVENQGASMHVLVEGNVTSKVFLLFVHGGPGSSSLIYHTDYISHHLENNYANVYWDQRNAGASQGSLNGANLNLQQMTDDLKKVIQVIKSKYGADSEVFILGHSYGGLLTSSFMTTSNNQSMVKGWIFVDGSHNYPLNDMLTRQMLMSVGQQQIALNKNAGNWNIIVDYCKNLTGLITKEESDQLVSYATDAEGMMDEVATVDILALNVVNAVKYNWPLSSMLFNYLYSSGADFNDDLYKTDLSAALGKVTTATLVLYGQYDFVCPPDLEMDFYNRINTADKKIAVSPVSGHNMMFQDESFFCSEVSDFIEVHK